MKEDTKYLYEYYELYWGWVEGFNATLNGYRVGHIHDRDTGYRDICKVLSIDEFNSPLGCIMWTIRKQLKNA